MKPATQITLAVLAVVGLAASTAAADWSGRRGDGGPTPFAMFDADGDGVVTLDEAKTVRDEQRARFDADGDGALTLEEFAPLHADVTRSRMVDAFQRLDADGDGRVTAAEYDRPLVRMGRRLDIGGDGDIDRDDLSARRAERGGHGWFGRR